MSEKRVYNKIQVVDEHDNFLGVETYFDAIEKKCIRRASRVFVFNESGKLLIQRRSEHISNPLLLDNSASGHVDEGETYDDAAVRELEEELGLSGYTLELIVATYKTTGFFNNIYRLTVPDGVEIVFDHHEVKEVIWMTVDEVDALVRNHRSECASLGESWSDLRDKLVQ